MRYSFRPDDCMLITIPIRSIRSVADSDDLMPDKFSCVFKDVYKVFLKGHPKAMGTAQLITGIFILCLGAVYLKWYDSVNAAHIAPSALFVVCGIVTFAAGHAPIMSVMKMSFILNIMGLFWGAAALGICLVTWTQSMDSANKDNMKNERMRTGLMCVLAALYVLQFILASVITFWESKAVCRVHFNTLPMITLKQDM